GQSNSAILSPVRVGVVQRPVVEQEELPRLHHQGHLVRFIERTGVGGQTTERTGIPPIGSPQQGQRILVGARDYLDAAVLHGGRGDGQPGRKVQHGLQLVVPPVL